MSGHKPRQYGDILSPEVRCEYDDEPWPCETKRQWDRLPKK